MAARILYCDDDSSRRRRSPCRVDRDDDRDEANYRHRIDDGHGNVDRSRHRRVCSDGSDSRDGLDGDSKTAAVRRNDDNDADDGGGGDNHSHFDDENNDRDSHDDLPHCNDSHMMMMVLEVAAVVEAAAVEDPSSFCRLLIPTTHPCLRLQRFRLREVVVAAVAAAAAGEVAVAAAEVAAAAVSLLSDHRVCRRRL